MWYGINGSNIFCKECGMTFYCINKFDYFCPNCYHGIEKVKEAIRKVELKKDNEKFNNSCGKKVRITYVPFDQFIKCKYCNIKPDKFSYTEGIIENFYPPNIYIINKNNCIEMFKLEQIYQIIEIDEFEM